MAGIEEKMKKEFAGIMESADRDGFGILRLR
jgi:hypothetical protein